MTVAGFLPTVANTYAPKTSAKIARPPMQHPIQPHMLASFQFLLLMAI
jgi:hypothetical protein